SSITRSFSTSATLPTRVVVSSASTFMRCSPGCKSIVAPKTARRPAGTARRPRISGIFEGGATQPAGMHRRSNAAGLAPRAARLKHMSASATPAMRQYLDAKQQHRDAILLFRMGDFYEMFYEDALVASRAL